MIGRGTVIYAIVALCLLLLIVAAAYSFLAHACTRYAPGFTQSGWRKITNGMPATVVRNLMGPPLWETDFDNDSGMWMYSRDKQTVFLAYRVSFSNSVVTRKQVSIDTD